jgi:hypothetical protein
MSGTAPDIQPLVNSRIAYRPYTFSLKELIVLINKRVMRVVVWLMIAAMLFSTVMYLVTAFTGI